MFQHFTAGCAIPGPRALGAVIFLVTAGSVLADVHYVDLNSTNATPPYTKWATAATNIQDAVDAAVAGDEIVVTNGTYATGGRDGSRVSVDKTLALRSVNGPGFTTISASVRGGGLRCVFLSGGASLSGFTLSGGQSYSATGGGAFGGTLTNCTLTGNLADTGQAYGISAYGGGAAYCTLNNCTVANNSAIADSVGCIGAYGGGAYRCTLSNCTLIGNSVQEGPFHQACYLQGGGAYDCTLNNCTLTRNSAVDGGGAYGGTLYNCTLTGNQAVYGGGAEYCALNNCIAYFNGYENYDAFCTFNYCCTTPLPYGLGNITNAPLFADSAGHLQSNSPCINAGKGSVIGATDLDGNSRIVGGTVDIGAYEFQSPVSQISYAWLQQYGFPITGATDSADPDGDAVDNYHEWLAGTDPTNPSSSPAELTIAVSRTNILVTWPTNAVGFTLQSTTNLVSPTVWNTNSAAPIIINGQFTVTNPITSPQQFFRLSH